MEIKRYSLSGTDKPPEAIPDSGSLPYVPFNSGTATENSTTAPGVVAIDTKPVRTTPGSMRGEARNGANATGTLTDIGTGLPGHGRVFADTFSGTDTLSGPDGFSRHDSRRTTADPAYDFYGSMSEEVLHRYLDKAITMNGFSNSIDAISDAQRKSDIEMLRDIGPKFIGRMAWFWGRVNDYELDKTCLQIEEDIAEIRDKSKDSQIIFQAGVMEWVEPKIDNVVCPEEVLREFGLAGPKRNFDFKAMLYPGGIPLDYPENRPDITNPETKMWFFYLAKRYIDAGCEAIHFGDMFEIDKRDTLEIATRHKHLWDLVSRVRRYGKSKNRGIVLFDVHKYPRSYLLYAPGSTKSWDRQLIFDFYSLGTFYSPNPAVPCIEMNDYPVKLNPNHGLLNLNEGGMHPLGWLCKRIPTLNEYDHGGDPTEPTGCTAAVVAGPDVNFTWGWTNITWFAMNNLLKRNQILIYTYYKMRCLDPYAHFQMTGRRGIHPGPGYPPGRVYQANTSDPNGQQQQTIKDIWNGVFDEPNFNWLHHNFTFENVANPYDISPSSNLVFVGSDKMYFIAQDGLIHGYIKVNGDYNGGTWLTVSPSYAADRPAHEQVKAKNSLVASPDGKMLLYIGVDGFIHGFRIIDAWRYSYIFTSDSGNIEPPGFKGPVYDGFMVKPMKIEGLRAVGNLIFPSADRIYYIAEWAGDRSHFIYGFQNPTGTFWRTLSPSYLADLLHGQRMASQFQAAGGLTYEHNKGRLYYRTTFGHLAYLQVRSLTDYYYVPCPGNFALHDQKLKIMGNLAIHYNAGKTIIYYVARYLPWAEDRVHCMVQELDGTWHTNSPSYAATRPGASVSVQAVSHADGNIAVSPDGRMVVYFGTDRRVYACYNIDDVAYSYNGALSTEADTVGDNSLQFNNSGLFYIRSLFRFTAAPLSVNCFKFQNDYCMNRNIEPYENP